MSYDVVIVGGGPAGLAAALVLGRARKRVLLCDAGPRRNAAATHVQGFVTRDGIAPDEFRRIARTQLEPYDTVSIRDVAVQDIVGRDGGFDVHLDGEEARTRRVLLCTGMVDDVPRRPGFAALWGHAVLQCPYCHGWEVRDRAFGYLAPRAESIDFALLLRGWTDDVIVFTDGRFGVPGDARARLAEAAIAIEERPIVGLEASASAGTPGLAAVVLVDGARVPRDVLFAHPAQRQIGLVSRLAPALDEHGYVRVDEHSATSITGIHAAGDLTSPQQSATLAAAAGFLAAAAMNRQLTVERVTRSRVA